MVDTFLQMAMDMDVVMKKRESLASAATLRIPLSRLGKPRETRLLGPRLYCTFRRADKT